MWKTVHNQSPEISVKVNYRLEIDTGRHVQKCWQLFNLDPVPGKEFVAVSVCSKHKPWSMGYQLRLPCTYLSVSIPLTNLRFILPCIWGPLCILPGAFPSVSYWGLQPSMSTGVFTALADSGLMAWGMKGKDLKGDKPEGAIVIELQMGVRGT